HNPDKSAAPKSTAQNIGGKITRAALKDAEDGYTKKANHYDKKNQTKLQREAAQNAKRTREEDGEKWTNKKDAEVRKSTKKHARTQVAEAKPKANIARQTGAALKAKSKIEGLLDKDKVVDTVADTLISDGSKYVAKKLVDNAAKKGTETAAGALLDGVGKGVGFFGKVGGFVLNIVGSADTANAPGNGSTELAEEIQRRAEKEAKSQEVIYENMSREHQTREEIRREENEERYRAARDGNLPVLEQSQRDIKRSKYIDQPTLGPSYPGMKK
ncbi:MAG: hypothetical protein M3R00_08150, partial [Pseudomonadota bacterium]|nr:hypothetical protein [Pseudomonadota bacterium]